jgi:spore coat polysaccharide biosynthesis protein SpsF (cytidylyltransferase family)
VSVAAIIQARMTSSRLPGKVLMDLNGRAALEQMLLRVGRSKRLDEVVVATTTNQTDDPIVDLCERMQTRVFRGDEKDVLGRFLGAARDAGADALVRLTGDCPMHDATVIDLCVDRFLASECDYLSNVMPRTYPDGLDTEIFTRRALEKTDQEAQTDYWREHVTTFIRDPENPGGFRLEVVVHDKDCAHLRWTLDTAEDLDRIRRYFSALPDGFSWLDALKIAPEIDQAA